MTLLTGNQTTPCSRIPRRPRSAIPWAIATILLALLSTSACNDILEVDPEDAVDSGDAVATAADVENVLAGVYNRVKVDEVWGNRYNIISELLGQNGDELIFSGTFDGLSDIYNKAQIPENEFGVRMWLDAYRAVNGANTVLSNLDRIANESVRDRVEGEARFLRGITYLFLVRFFAPPWNAGDPTQLLGLPLELEQTDGISEDLFKARSSLSDTYALILSDLETAQALLPSVPSDRGRATTWAASGFLSEVYLAQGRYAEAAAAANRVIEDGPHSLVENYADAFNNQNDSPEDVFAIQQTALQPSGGNRAFYTSQAPNVGRGDMDIMPAHLALYEPGDDRLDMFFKGTGIKPGIDRSAKWFDEFISVPIIRLAEMYLTRAEANFRTGVVVGPNTPLEDVNIIRERVSLDPLESIDLDAILRERRLELAWEGHTLHDLKRTGGSATLQGQVFDFDHPRLILFIPRREVETNPNLEQNP